MGGTPWHSKGCIACRKRKVKCDEQEPECARCIKRGVKCPGYIRTRIYIHHPSVKYRDEARTAIPISQSQFQSSAQQLCGPLACSQAVNVVQQTTPAPLTQPSPSGSTWQSRPMVREQIFSSFLSLLFGQTHPMSALNIWQYLIFSFGQLPRRSGTLDRALSAMSCLYLGKMNNDDRLFHYGLNLYGAAVQNVKSSVLRNTCDADTIYTTVIFQDLESYCCSFDFRTFLAHTQGTSAILHCHRDSLPRNPLLDAIYNQHQKMRLMIATAGVNITEEEHQYLTNSTDGLSTAVSKLFALFAEFGPLSAMLNRTEIDDPEQRAKALGACLMQEEKIRAWYAQYVTPNSMFNCEAKDCNTDKLPSTERLFGSGYRFSSLDDARMHHYYFVALATVQPWIQRLQRWAQPQPTATMDLWAPVTTPPHSEGQHEIPEFLADELCRMMPYYAKNTDQLSATGMLLFPVVAAIKIYIGLGQWEKFTWCLNALRLIGYRGLTMCNRLIDVYSNCWNNRNIDPWPIPCRSLRDDMTLFERSAESQNACASNETPRSPVSEGRNIAKAAQSLRTVVPERSVNTSE
ncbi:Fungal Zn(2)-Cys(6) binuclear cluster domain-containing protein [Penicillium ucsense]|uniref:Fungal Zn(2)-Cys(6) binuclear cluster domain-containing protein n=1 Tax=Penicillium ucsense TaxID=2839758 RepID=A0A8J8W7M0_9EURO|nr:Fungal Zn(2)-Cys(6) binuclear cluster domain-containing protein [Penicillium ucsense]KAF7734211.1 Fungal Zn(2)-Cys(6) binuclear cluster domain-containing protein [Penicillium ucsense]